MAGHILELRGCTPEPLGNYLKGLGVFRLIAEQADPQARAWWKDGFLHIQSRFTTNDQLISWLKDNYAPTGILAPWSVNSGIWPPKHLPPPRGDKRATPNSVLRHLVNSTHPRFRFLKQSVATFLQSFGGTSGLPSQEADLSDDLKEVLKELESQTKKARMRSSLLRDLRNRMEDRNCIAWFDSIGTVRTGRDTPAILFSLLADGGAEGVNSFVGNFYGRLCDHLPVDSDPNDFWGSEPGLRSVARLKNALFGDNCPEAREADAAGGLYWPSLVEAPNIGQEFIANPKKRAQPWEFILAMEGLPIWSSAATRRGELLPQDRVSFPFFCDSSLGGLLTPAFTEMPGSESITNGEIWCPLWQMPASLAEVGRLFTEGRLVAFDKTAFRASQFASAVASMGVERGIVAFQRVGLLERSGSGDNTTSLAIHLGTWATRRLEHLELLAELSTFEESVVSNLHWNANQPRRLLLARQRFEDALFDVARQSLSEDVCSRRERFLTLLAHTTNLECELGRTLGKVKVKVKGQLSEKMVSPVSALDANWFKACRLDDASYRLARAVAGITAWGESNINGREQPTVECVRANLLAVVRPWGVWEWFDAKRHRGFHDASAWSRGAPLEANLAAVLRRRLIDAQKGSGDGLPLWSSYGAGFADLLAFWHGEINQERLSDLIHGLALVDSGRWDQSKIDDRQQRDEPTPDLQTSAVWFDADDEARITLTPVRWRGRPLVSSDDLRAAFELPRVYHLLKLCFVGGRLPRRPVEGQTAARTGEEPFPSRCLDVLTLLQAGRLADAARLAAQRLRARGYPRLLRDGDLQALDMSLNECRRLAGMLLIPVRQPGVCAALAIKPEITT